MSWTKAKGGPKLCCELTQERDNALGLLAGQFDIAQDDFHDGVNPGHKHGALIFIGGIEVKDVTALEHHGLLQPASTATVRQGQERYKAAPQIRHGAGP
jgi:hypothetical protein